MRPCALEWDPWWPGALTMNSDLTTLSSYVGGVLFVCEGFLSGLGRELLMMRALLIPISDHGWQAFEVFLAIEPIRRTISTHTRLGFLHIRFSYSLGIFIS